MSIQPNPSLWFIIDDDIDDQEIFMISAQKADPEIQCVFANDGVFALEKFKEDPTFNPGCIFLDVNMPRMNGVECLEELQHIDRAMAAPVYMCSTSADPKIIAKTKALGAKEFIVKPPTISEFAALLKKVKSVL